MTMSMHKLFAAAVVVAASYAAPVLAAEGGPEPPQQKWSFSGPFGTFDRAQLQRGFKVYREVCATCHSLSLVSFRNLAQEGGPEFSEAQVKALAAEYKVKDGPNDAGDMFERPGRLSDYWPSPFPNENAARSANGGGLPPETVVTVPPSVSAHQNPDTPAIAGEPADPATAPERTITYTVTGDRQLFDLVTVIYTDEQGFPRTDINVALPWTRTVVLNPGVNLKSVTATSVAGKLNCAISNGSGDLLVQQNAGTILAACTN